MTKKCLSCGLEFNTYKSYQKFCSRTCYADFIRGKPAKHNHTFKNGNMINLKNGTRKQPCGYIYIYSSTHPRAKKGNRYVAEHILVAEHHLKRYLTNKEIVHHINEQKDDNRPENLYVFDSMGCHTSYHNLLRNNPLLINKITKSNLPL